LPVSRAEDPVAQEEKFGALLRRLRAGAGLTLEQLAEAAGLSDRALSNLERGVNVRPRARTVRAIADGLGAGPADLDDLLAAARRARTAQRPEPAPLTPRRIAGFTGRAEELALIAAWTTHSGPAAPVVAISGDAGVGKTTLAARAAEAWPPGDRLHADLRGLDARPATAVQVLGRLIRAVSPEVRAVPRDVGEASALWQTLIRDRRLVVVLDNAISESQVRPVLPASGPAVTLVTSRRSLSGLDDVFRLRLDPLPEDDAVRMLAAVPGRAPASPIQLLRLAELCVGIPLALRIAGQLLSRPGTTTAGLITRLAAEERRLDTLAVGDLQVRAAFDLSYRQLPEPARRLLRRLSLVPGSSFGPELAAVLTGEPPAVAEDILDDLVDLSLLQQRPDGRLEFHELLRLYAAGELDRAESAAERAATLRRLHDRLRPEVSIGAP
jgi:transcriptional regulator with XRE-family HTH domain